MQFRCTFAPNAHISARLYYTYAQSSLLSTVSADISSREDHCAGAGAWRGSSEPYAPLRHALSESVSEPTDISG